MKNNKWSQSQHKKNKPTCRHINQKKPVESPKFILFFLLFMLCQPAFSSTNLPQHSPVPGGIAIIDLGQHQQKPEVKFRNKRIMVIKDNTQWLAIVGIPLSTKKGKYHITLKHPQKNKIYFTVKHKEYKKQYLTIKNKRLVNPNKDDMKQIKQDRIKINKATRHWLDINEINMLFDLPVKGPLSSSFGKRRYFNKQPRNPHSGLDIAVIRGTPVKAPEQGIIISSGHFFFSGKTVFLDHGQGLISSFSHLSEILVKPGQAVKRGDVLGKAGKTGRVTGAHLHWTVRLNRTAVDPVLFLGTRTK